MNTESLNCLLFDLLDMEAIQEAANSMDDLQDSENSIEFQRKVMKIGLVTDDIVMNPLNGLKCVTNPVNFEKNRVPTAGGLFSEEIFGTTLDERKKTLGYIDLKHKFFHPYVYEVICRFFPALEKIAAGEGVWKLTETNEIVRASEDDPDYNPDNTGLEWIMSVIEKVNFKENTSFQRKERLQFFNNVKKLNQLFISKLLVIPIAYRDVNLNAKVLKNSPINVMYSKIIRYANSLTGGEIGFVNNLALYNIQKTMVEIRKYGQKLIEKKHGFFKKSVLGKSNDYGYRSVISVPNITYYDKPSDMPIDVFNIGIPLSQCCILAFPFIFSWVLDFFRKQFVESGPMFPVYKKNDKGEWVLIEKELDNPLSVYTEDYIHKMIDRFINTPQRRFETISVTLKDGTEASLIFTGRGYTNDKDHPMSATISQRPMTWTDLLYMAAEDCTKNLHNYMTRYPLTNFQAMFVNRIHVLSTMRTTSMIVNGKLYKHYPEIHMDWEDSKIASFFSDTTTMSNAMLEEAGADYDGDQVSDRFPYSLEANQEAEELMHSIKHFLSLTGRVIRTINNEAYLTCYNMTKDEG